MNIKYFIFSLLGINSNSSDESKTILDNFEKALVFTDKSLEKEFKERKEIYKEFFIEYTRKFKKAPKTFEKKVEELIFIRDFIKKYNIEHNNLYKRNIFHYYFKSINFSDTYIGKETEKSEKSEKYNILWIEENSIKYALNDLKEENKRYEIEINNIIKKIYYSKSYYYYHYSEDYVYDTVYIKDLQINKKDYESNFPSLKDDTDYEYIIDELIKYCNFEEKSQKYLYNYIWSFLEFLVYIYEKNEIYLNGKRDVNKEAEIVKEIINFTNNYNKNKKKSKQLNWKDIYEILLSIDDRSFSLYNPCFSEKPYFDEDDDVTINRENSFYKIRKIGEEYYIYQILDDEAYRLRKINDFKRFKKTQIIYNILDKQLDKKKYHRYLDNGFLLKPLFNEETICFF